MNFVTEHITDFAALFFPNICVSCGCAMGKGEDVICTFCQFYLPKTNYHLERNNAIEKHFWGRVEIFRAVSYCYFQKGSRIQHLIHELKYRKKLEVGIKLGKMYGAELIACDDFKSVDVILPVPLHKSKEIQRGFNQADLLCEGLSTTMERPWMKNILVRTKKTETQTHKTRFERWQNVGTVFDITDKKILEGKHVLIADDVITTGSTLEACANSILSIAGTSVSIATIACAVR